MGRPKHTLPNWCCPISLWHIADMSLVLTNVCFVGRNGHDAVVTPACDPKRTFSRGPLLDRGPLETIYPRPISLSETAMPRANCQTRLSHEWYRLL